MSLPELFANSPTPGMVAPFTSLAADVTTTPAAGTVETWTFRAGPPSALAQAGQFRFVVDNEICIDVTGGAGTSRQVQRGAEGSAITTHAMGTGVFHALTAAALPNASVDSSGASTVTPKAHAQSLHGRGGTDTMLNGLEISDTSAQQTNHKFILGPRTTTALAFPVATFQPKAASLVMSMDVAPSSGAAASSLNGFAWIDVCSAHVIDDNPFTGVTLRLGNQGTPFCEVTTRKFNGATAAPLWLASDYNGSGDPQIYLTPQTATNPNVLLGYDGSDVFVGPHVAPATSAVRGGYLYLSTCAGAPTGVPAQVNSVWSALRYDSTNHKIWVYDNVAAAWKGVVLA